MFLHVVEQVSSLSELLVAHLAMVGLLARVFAHVHLQVATQRKKLLAFGTLVLFDA